MEACARGSHYVGIGKLVVVRQIKPVQLACSTHCNIVILTASCVVLCHLLNTFCLPILLYGLEAVPILNANLRTPQSPWNVALYKIFKLKNLSNLYYVQYFMGTLPVICALDSRKLNFLQKQSVHHTVSNKSVIFIDCC